MIFVDTSAIYAYLVPADRFHSASRAEFDRFEAEREQLVTSSYVVHEAISLLQTRWGIGPVRKFLNDFSRAVHDVVWVDERLHELALAALLGAGKRHISLTDWSSFTIMRSHRIRHAFTFDPDFADQGFEVRPRGA